LPKAKPMRRHVVDAADLARLAKGLGGVGELGLMVYLGAIEGLRWVGSLVCGSARSTWRPGLSP
jgi:hypothetical protein